MTLGILLVGFLGGLNSLTLFSVQILGIDTLMGCKEVRTQGMCFLRTPTDTAHTAGETVRAGGAPYRTDS